MGGRIFRFVRVLVTAYCFIGAGVFVSGMVSWFFGAPRWLEVPWSEVRDWTVSADGELYVGVGFYERVLRYDAEGRFVASYPGGTSRGGWRLSSDREGRIYSLAYDDVEAFSADWEPLGRERGERKTPRTWTLGAGGRPIHTPEAKGKRLARAIRPGELLFSKDSGYGPRQVFLAENGDTFEFEDGHIVRRAPDGTVKFQRGNPWWMYWAGFPWPAALAWPGFIVAGWMWNRGEEA